MLEVLRGEQAMAILRELLRRHPTLRAETDDLVRDLVSSVDPLEVAAGVRLQLEALTLEDLAARSGRRRGSFVEPAEAAWALVEAVVEPHIRDILSFAEAGLDEAARRRCEGVLLGLYSAREPMGHEVLIYCEDAPAELAGWTVERWRRAGGPGRDTRRLGPDALVELVEWASFLEQFA